MMVPDMSKQGTRLLLLGFVGEMFLGQRSSPLVRAAKWTRIRWSVELDAGTRRGWVVRIRVFEDGSGWRRDFIMVGRFIEGMAVGNPCEAR
jgi:hypothetical protein